MAPGSVILKRMKKISLVLLCALCACAGNPSRLGRYRIQTQRETPYYLTTDAEKVQDSCPGNDILKQYDCPIDAPEGLRCFDVYRVQGSPVPEQRYTLLRETIETQNVTAQPECPTNVSDCVSFLKALDYNLEFSWYVANFPSSSFEQCRETYDCKRLDCYQPLPTEQGSSRSTLISCVYKKNQLFFVGSEIVCRPVVHGS